MRTLNELDHLSWSTAEVSQLQICTSAGTQYRDVLSPAVFTEYKVAMSEGEIFPPVRAVFDGTKYIVVDGFHRLHALSLMGRPTVTVEYVDGDLADAQYLALRSNTKHGLPRSNADKEKVVTAALSHPLTRDLSDNQIAQICGVSRSFVGAVRDPAVRKRQAINNEKRIIAESEKIASNFCSATTESPETLSEDDIAGDEYENIDLSAGEYPGEAELLANEKKFEADMERLASMLDADDKMAHLWEENKRLSHLVVMKDLRIKELMNEKSAAIKMVKDLQREQEKFLSANHRRMTRSIRLDATVAGQAQVLQDVRDGFGL